MSIWKFVVAATLMFGVAESVGAGKAEDSILGGAGVTLTATSEIEAFICSYNEEGGMISEIVEKAFEVSGLTESAQLEFIRDPLKLDLADVADVGQIVFPMYKPRCDIRSLLSSHTSMLCEDFAWSEPLFHVIISGYVSAEQDWTPKSNSELKGRTICQPKGEVSFYLRERGITDLNARLVTAATPAACLEQVKAGESDIAILPMVSAQPALAKAEMANAFRQAQTLDIALGVHAITGKEHPNAVDKINALNLGLEQIRSDGTWFEIVKEHSGGHSHGERHAAHSSD